MKTKEILIKKYANRRLYNADESKYLKLEDVAQLIRDGHDVKVVDTSSKEDITKQILAQIVMEEERNRKDILPLSLFYKIIRSNQDFIRDFFENYLNQTIDAYLVYREAMDDKIRHMKDLNRLPMEMGDIFMKNFLFPGGVNSVNKGDDRRL